MFYSRSVSTLRPGVNIYGYVFAEHGVGEEARTLVQIARQAELDYAVIPYTETFSRQAVAFDDLGERESTFDINLIIVNADTVPKFVEHVGPEVLQGRYNIGMWAWEVEDLPPKMARAAEHLDEIWSCSRFSAEAIARSVSCPVQALPLPVTVPKPPPGTRADLGLTDEFLFLFCFDFNSIFERKNALAVIDAFRRAFKPGEGAELLIKTINGDDFQDQLQRLHAASLDRPDVKVVDGYLQAQEQRVLMNTCDAYVSLHRSEGFGFTMAEAMALGKPVIATGYSGNMDFMTEANSYPVPFERVHVGPGSAPYPADSYWAQPDVAAAAERMRRVFDRPDEARKKSKQARQDIETRHTPELKAQVVLERLQAIREQSLPKTKRSSYTVLSYGEDSSGDGATVRDEILESRKRHTDRTYRAFDSLKSLMASQLHRLTDDDIDSDLICGSLDGARLDSDGRVGLWGWAYDPRTNTPARAIALVVNDRQVPIQIRVGSERPDVASYLGRPELNSVGWSFMVAPSFLAEGKNDFEAYALLDDGRFGRVAGKDGNGLSVTIS